jgi:hypothetical protein
MTCDGQAFEPVTLARPIAGSVSFCSRFLAGADSGAMDSETKTWGTRKPDDGLTVFPTPDVSDSARSGCDPARRKSLGRQVNLRDVATLFPTEAGRRAGRAQPVSPNATTHPSLDSPATRCLPTPTASEALRGSPSSKDSKGNPGLTAAVIDLLPTPLAGNNRKSRPSILRERCGPGLEQVIEMVLGTMPAELRAWEEAPPSWTGVRMNRRSGGGS